MTILGLLQNMWVRDPERCRAMIAAQGARLRRRMIATWMPATPSGRALHSAFGDLFELITWENATPVVAGRSDAAPPADHWHIRALLLEFEPDVVLAFGRPSIAACRQHPSIPILIEARHPSPRAAGCTTLPTLEEAAAQLRARL